MEPTCRHFGLHKALLTVSAATSLLLVGWMLWLMQFGIDVTDEGYYLVWLAEPSRYFSTVSLFGFVYHPLHWLTDGDIVAMRRINFLISYALSYALSYVLLRQVLPAIARRDRIIVSAAIACAVLTLYRLWLPSPSYNALTLQGLMITTIGLLFAERADNGSSRVGWVLIGVGGCLTFLAKASSAIALCVVVVGYLVAANKWNWRHAFLSGLTSLGLLLTFIYAIDGSIYVFMQRLTSGIEMLEAMKSGHSIGGMLRIDGFGFSGSDLRTILLLLPLVVTASLLAMASSHISYVTGLAIQFAAAIAIATVVAGYGLIHASGFCHLLILIAPCASVIIALFMTRGRILKLLSRAQYALVIMLMFMPYTFAFGSGNNYAWMGGLAGIFLVLAGMVAFMPCAHITKSAAVLLPITFVVQFLAASIVMVGIQAPYYQPQPLTLSNTPTLIGGGTVVLSSDYSRYITELRQKAKKVGFAPGTPVIDLTGHSPGVIYFLGGKNTAQPWMMGNFPGYDGGGNRLAEWSLQKTSCDELARAWVFVEPQGKVAISKEVLHAIGADLTRDYQAALHHQTVKGLSGFASVSEQQLLQPKRSIKEAVIACKSMRH